MNDLEETIVAIASPPGGAARGIVRVSGPGVVACLAAVFRAEGARCLAEVGHPAALAGNLHLDSLASPLPCEVYYWPGRKSYTGEPVAEFHTLGGPPLLDLLIEQLCKSGARLAPSGVRLAQPGEFTLRAFLSGRMDLTQAEAVLGVIDARDQRQLDVALEQLAGGLARPLHELRDVLLDLLGHLEAGFDFADEDLPFIEPEELARQLLYAAAITNKLAQRISTRATAEELPSVVLVGRPNTGKSSLFNALSEKSKAIVSSHAGTTRDYLTAKLDLDGVSCRLIDTAGVDMEDAAWTEVERESRESAVRQAQQAGVRILCLDSTSAADKLDELDSGLHETIVVLTKVDAAEDFDEAVALHGGAIATSSFTCEGIDALRRRLREAVLAAAAGSSAVVAPTAARCRESIRLASESLGCAYEIAQDHIAANRAEKSCTIDGEELIAAELRVALDELGKVVGTIYTDDILERIFSRFCVGK